MIDIRGNPKTGFLVPIYNDLLYAQTLSEAIYFAHKNNYVIRNIIIVPPMLTKAEKDAVFASLRQAHLRQFVRVLFEGSENIW